MGGKRVVPDINCILQFSNYLYFEDKAGLADSFKDLRSCIIPRSEGWRAMEAAGVQSLSRSLEYELVDAPDPEDDDNLLARINDRIDLLKRIIYSEQSGENLDIESICKLKDLKCYTVQKLVIRKSIYAKERKIVADPEEVPAVLIENLLYYVKSDYYNPNWAAISRELAYYIHPFGEIRSIAMGIKEVLSAETPEQAKDSLDSLDYPPFESGGQAPISINVGDVTEEPEGNIDDEQRLRTLPIGNEPPQVDLGEKPTSRPQGQKPRTTKQTGHLISYVSKGGKETSPNNSLAQKRRTIEEIGIAHVMRFEKEQKREPKDMNRDKPNHPGYDIESADENGEIRFIEVKSLSGYWTGLNPGQMTPREFESAMEYGGSYWLYIVERAKDKDYKIFCIQNPANQVDIFAFDEGWKCIAEIPSNQNEEDD
jgi:hypothetical protein